MSVLATPVDRPVRLRAVTSLLGPAFVTAVAYVDPGNVATNVAAGSRYGYLLLWVVLLANAMAAVMQYLSAKLGVATGRSLPELLGDRLPAGGRIGFWLQAELVMMATDLAEVLGGAIALQVLLGLPLLAGGLVTGGVSLALLITHGQRQRSFEQLVTGFLVVIAAGFLVGFLVGAPPPGELAAGLLPRLADSRSVLLTASILGATMMPHAVYLHSALARDRFPSVPPHRQRQVLRTVRWDVGAAMLLAGTVNATMLVMAGGLLRGSAAADSLAEVPAALDGTVGGLVGLSFALALLASGVASTSVGCLAGQVVMGGLLRRTVPVLARRLVALAPGLLVLGCGADPTLALVLSQVVLSFGIPFAVIPLVRLTARRSVMGPAVNHRATTVAAAGITGVVVVVNVLLIGLTAGAAQLW